MTKLYDLINTIQDIELNDHVLNDCDMSEEEKQRTAAAALKKIHMEQEKNIIIKEVSIKRSRKLKKKTVMLAAALIVIMAFGVCAYAAEFFQLGQVGKGDNKITTASLEDSRQFKAREEFQQFWEREWVKQEKGGYERVPQAAIDKETKRLMEKYNLVEDAGESKDVSSIEETFSKAGIENILGDNQQIFSSPKSHYYYTDSGRIGLIGGTDSGGKETYYELTCIPNNIADFYGSWKTLFDESSITEEWDFITDEGIPVKNLMAQLENEDKEKTIEDGYIIAAPGIYIYQSILFVKDHTITLFVSSTDKNDPFGQSKEKFEQMINKFDFSKLQ